MRTLAIGDIHGCYTAFNALLEVIELQPDDTLVTLGDYVDRGSGSRQVIERLLKLRETYHVVTLMGNHVMIESRDSKDMRKMWLGFGGDATVESYGGSLENVPWSHWHFLEKKCVLLWETETHFFVHAGVYNEKPLHAQSDSSCLWSTFDSVKPHPSSKIMVCGHTSQKNGLPCDLGFAVCIDTWAYGDGWLSCLCVETGEVWQANDWGQTRAFLLKGLPR